MHTKEEHTEDANEVGPESADTSEETADTTAPDETGAKHQEQTRSSPVAIVVLLFCTLLAAAGVTWFVTQELPKRAAREAVPALPATTTASTSLAATTPPTPPPQETATFSREGFRITLPEGWQGVLPSMAPPEGIGNTKQAFALPGTTCTIVYAHMYTDTVEYRQTTGYTDVTNNEHLIGRIERRIPATYASTSTSTRELKHSSSPYEPHEFAFSYQPLYYDNASGDATRNAFVLFAPQGTTVERDCHADFIALIGSIEEALPQHTLTQNDQGGLYIQTSRTGTDLLFRMSPSNDLYRITRLSAGAVFKPTITGETLYYVHNSGALYELPLFAANAPLRAPLPLAPGERVNDFVVASGTIEYLRGAWCRSNPEECALTHESYDLLTGMITTLETDVSTPTLKADEVTTQSLALEDGTLVAGPQNSEGIAPQRIPIVTY